MESVFQVRSEDCQTELTKKCEERSKTFKDGDEWTENVRARILFASDLVAKDVLYHHQCSTNFRTSRFIPKKFNPMAKNKKGAGRKKKMKNSQMPLRKC